VKTPFLLSLGLVVSASTASAALDDTFTAEEKAVLKEVDGAHFIKARRAAEQLLEKNPDSFVATWTMARVHHDEEGNHARALYYLKRASELLDSRDDTWGQRLLLEEYDIVYEMARNQEALDVLDVYERRYGPPPPNLRIWPLFKLGRYEESSAISTRLAGSKELHERIWGYNGLLSIAFEQHDRLRAHHWALEGVRATDDKSCTILLNAGGTAYTNFRIPDAEELMLRADKAKDCTATPYDQLAVLAMLQGQPQKALSALQTAKKRYVEKRYRPQFALVRREVLTDLLGVLGKELDAVKMAADLYRQPARTGMTSSPAKVERLRRALRYAFALDGQIDKLEEASSFGPRLKGTATNSPELTKAMATRWEVRRTLIQLLSEDDRLLLVVRPNLSDVGDWAAWRVGDLTQVLGAGIMKSAIARARDLDAQSPEAAAYYDALAAELALADGDEDDALSLASVALQKLPREEALIRWRAHAIRAEAGRRSGRDANARADWDVVMRQWPTILRVLDFRLPASVSHDGSALGDEAAGRLSRSTRFRVEEQAPYKLRAEAGGKGVLICLTDAAGSRLTCSTAETVDATLEAFHSEAFSPKVSLTDSDLRSLDGSPVRVSADAALKKVLEP
jgi:tetratricopeptide (TPR) repeat protein